MAPVSHHQILVLLTTVLLFIISKTFGEKIRYASAGDCDRYSLDAVYTEKFKVITENVFEDSRAFVFRVSDLVADSLTSIMAQLPDRDASDIQEKKIFEQFRSLKSSFSSRVTKMQKNITDAWVKLVDSNYDLLYDNDQSSLTDYAQKVHNMAGAYSEARKSLDNTMKDFVIFVKNTVANGLQGISLAADAALKKAEENKNETASEESSTENQKELSEDEKILGKKLEIAEMIVQGFLGNVTIEIIKRKIDLFKKVTVEPENRDSVLDDLHFDVLMIKNRILALCNSALPNDKGSVDLARRSIYTYWADLAEQMYKERLKSKPSAMTSGDMYYKKLWDDENMLLDTLLDLMEMY